jgi:prepilin-type N-terminal cleavage/methylation domain-containing protein
MNKSQGFSLIELMIALAVLVMAAASSLFFLSSFQQQRSLILGGQSVATLLRDAQQRSINQEQGRYWGVRFEDLSPKGRYTLFNVAGVPFSVITATTVMFLKGSLEFLQPVAGREIDIVFDKISGAIKNDDRCLTDPVNTSTTVQIGIVNNNSASTSVRIYCNGRIEF